MAKKTRTEVMWGLWRDEAGYSLRFFQTRFQARAYIKGHPLGPFRVIRVRITEVR